MAKPANLRQAILDQAMRGETTHQEPSAPATSQPGPELIGRPHLPSRQASRIGKASVTGYFVPAVRRQLRKLAADSDTTIQALLGEALNDLFAKHGLPEIVEPEQGPSGR